MADSILPGSEGALPKDGALDGWKLAHPIVGVPGGDLKGVHPIAAARGDDSTGVYPIVVAQGAGLNGVHPIADRTPAQWMKI